MAESAKNGPETRDAGKRKVRQKGILLKKKFSILNFTG